MNQTKPGYMKKFVLLVVFIIPLIVLSQEKEKNIDFKFHGFVKSDLFMDTREGVMVREGHFLLYPKNELLDPDGEDVNANLQLNMLSIQTRLNLLVTGPDVWKAKSSAYIEGEFFGTTDADINGFRLRHAFIKLQWPKTMLLAGQYWHPMFNTQCYPGTVSFNTGAPFQPFSRNPQIRAKQNFGKFNVVATAFWQRDFRSTGPEGVSASYLWNSAIPMFNLRFEYQSTNETKGTEFLAGVSANFKTLTPRIQTDSLYKTNTKISSVGFSAYAKYKGKNITAKLMGFYGGDAYDMTMLGGYVVKDVVDPEKNMLSYTPVCVTSVWFDIHTNGPKFQYGLFGGYTKNLGPREEVQGNFAKYARGLDMGHIYRISGRFIYNVNNFRLAPEIEYTVAGYATEYGDNLNVTKTNAIGNIRFLIGFYYFF